MKTMDFSENVAACDLNTGRCSQLIELMKVCEYCIEVKGHFLILTQVHLHMKIKTSFYQKTLGGLTLARSGGCH